MDFFKDSDKKQFDFQPEQLSFSYENMDLELKGSRLNPAELIFGRFSRDDIYRMLEEASVFELLKERGYKDFTLEVLPLSELDNRIFVKTGASEVLIHIRLKMNDFYFQKIDQSLKMIYIDWLLTQNVKMGKLEGKKVLFEGQEYPGLNVFKEVTKFIHNLSIQVGANGIFNVPEYFHDAVLFHKSFKFLHPAKEGIFRALINDFKKYSLRKLSELIHNHRIYNETKSEVFLWKHGEMFYSDSEDLNHRIFNSQYFQEVEKYKNRYQFKILGKIE